MANKESFPPVVHIIGAGNVGVWTAYRLTKLYEQAGKPIPEIHIYDKNDGAAKQISAQIGAHLQPDETLHDFEHGLHLINLWNKFTDGGRMMGDETDLKKRLEKFDERGLEWLLMYAQADGKVGKKAFIKRLEDQIKLGTRSMVLWQEAMTELDGENGIKDFRRDANYRYGHANNTNEPNRGILKFLDPNLPTDYVDESVEICNRNGLQSVPIGKDDPARGGILANYGLHGVAERLKQSTCLLQDGGAFQSEVATRKLMEHMDVGGKGHGTEAGKFNVTFHKGQEITDIDFSEQNKISTLKTSDGDVPIEESASVVFATGNMTQLLRDKGMGDEVPMMGICGVTQNIRVPLEFFGDPKNRPQFAIKSVTTGENGVGITKCVITPDYEYNERGEVTGAFIRVGGQFGFRERGLEKLGFLEEIEGNLDKDLRGFAEEALQRELIVMDELWPGIVQAARDKYYTDNPHETRVKLVKPTDRDPNDPKIFKQWLQGRPGSPDHCAMVGQLDRNVDGKKKAVSNAFSVMGRGSGGVSFVHADAEMLFQRMCLHRTATQVDIPDAGGSRIDNIGTTADPRRFSSSRGIFSYVDKDGHRVPISGSINGAESRQHAIDAIYTLAQKAPAPDTHGTGAGVQGVATGTNQERARA